MGLGLRASGLKIYCVAGVRDLGLRAWNVRKFRMRGLHEICVQGCKLQDKGLGFGVLAFRVKR